MPTATYNITDDKLRLKLDDRLSTEDYATARQAGYVWWPGQKLFAAKWNPEAENFALRFVEEIEEQDTADDVEQRVERFAARAESAEQSADAAAAHLASGKANTKRRRENALNSEERNTELALHWQRRIEGAIRHATYKDKPEVIARRVKGLEADERKQQREATECEQQRAYWDDEFLDLPGALSIANHACSIYIVLPGESFPVSVWSALRDGKLDVATAKAHCIAKHAENLDRANRWLAHLADRLTYERALLAATGWVQPEKRKSLKQTLPLLNYQQEIFRIPSRYRRGEINNIPQVALTAKQFAAIGKEYKGTDIVDGTHKIRIAIVRASDHEHLDQRSPGGSVRVAVYVTDSRAHDRPEAPEAEEAA